MNRVEWELYGETNVNDVVDKTKKGLDGIEKNAKRVNDAFSMSASSIFLRFLGPMALLQIAISKIGEAMERNKQLAQDGFKTLADGEDKYASAQQSRMAAFFQAQEQEIKAKEQSAAGQKLATEKFFEDRGFWKSLWDAPVSTFAIMMGELGLGDGAGAEWIQKGAAEDFAKEQKAQDKKMDGGGATSTSFKGPEGFGNVIGVGANPVLESMTLQLQVQREMLEQLQFANSLRSNDTDFTKGDYENYTPYGM
jgi:hypothetical protein